MMQDATPAPAKPAPQQALELGHIRHKRKISPNESCIRTDLIELAPNAGKAAVLESMFAAYRERASS